MAQFLNKGDHIFIPFHENGNNMIGNYGSARIYLSIETAMKYVGKRAHEIVEYAPIVRCGNCKYFVPAENVGADDWEGECMYNDCTYVDTSDFCSRGETRRDTEVKDDG